MIFKSYERIVFTGDSVTDAEKKQPYGEGESANLGTGYVRMIENLLSTFYPELFLRITNRGISGNTSRNLVRRFDSDVINLNPDYISICIGVNDVWRQFDVPSIPEGSVFPDEYERNLSEMIEKSIKIAKKVFIMTPYYMEPLKEDTMRKRMDEYGDICKRLSEKYGCELIDLQAMFDKYFEFRHSTYIAYDRVHPNQIGATLIANEFLKHCGFDYSHKPE